MVTKYKKDLKMQKYIGGGTYELLDVLDANGSKTGQTKPRHLVHRDGDWHRAVDIWLVNPERGILLQRRVANKDSWPNRWDISCGGHLSAGDDPLAGAMRELFEELGLIVQPENLHFLLTTKTSSHPAPDFINNSFNDLYIYYTDRELKDFVMQTSEISELKYVSPDELKSLVAQDNSETLVPHEQLYEALFQYLEQAKNKKR